MAISPKDRLDLLQKMSRNWLTLRRAIDALSEEQMTRSNTVGQWSVKDILAHITAWDRVVIGHIEAAENGEPPRRFSREEVDAFNREVIDETVDYDLADVMEDLNETHDELMSLIETTRALTKDLIRPVAYEHYTEHAAELRELARSSRPPG
jgi:hypothetical protein